MACPLSRTKDNFEMQFGVNHLGHFYLTSLLIPPLKAASTSRVVNVSSMGHTTGKIDLDDLNWNTRPYQSLQSYSQSKLANILFSSELNRRFSEHNITSYSLHPGGIRTELGRHMVADWVFYALFPLIWYFTKDPWHGCQTTLFCAVAPGIESLGGKYFSDCKIKKLQPHAVDATVAKKLWEKSEQLLGINFGKV